MMRLSICIPTYNRAGFLGELLESIARQKGYSLDVEVVISDNASTDNTIDIVDKYRGVINNLVYDRSPENVGPDRNFLKVVSLASGDYCWLMGSDDRLEEGAIAEIERHSFRGVEGSQIAGMSLNRRAYNFDMTVPFAERPVAGGKLPHDALIRGDAKIFSILGDYLGYLSGQIVRRDLWQEVVSNEDVTPFFNAYIHVYVIGRMIQKCPAWRYVVMPCIGWRSGNDSFLAEGELKRMSIDVLGYEGIARGLFGSRSRAYHDINRTVATVHVRYAVAGAKLNGLPSSFFGKAFSMLVRTYWRYPSFWMRTAPIFLVPASVIRMARWGYRKTLKRA